MLLFLLPKAEVVVGRPVLLVAIRGVVLVVVLTGPSAPDVDTPWANGVKSIVKNSSCDDHMTVKEGLKVSQQTRVQTKQGECPSALVFKTSTVGLQLTSKKGEKANQK